MDELKEIIADAVSETLENMAFVDICPTDTKTPYDEHLVRMRVEILINAPFPGEIRLVLPLSLAVTFAKNMYNLSEKEVTDPIINDVLGEIINIVAGRIMADILPEDQTFQLGLPLVGHDVFVEAEAESLDLEFDAEGYPFWVIMFGDGFLK